jgi:AcrR family transcriptional regulator
VTSALRPSTLAVVPVPVAPALRLRKGEATRAAILDAALGIARREGLEGLTIGVLAEQAGMSKSGAFAHFGSREELQLAVLKAYAERFVDEVLRPAVARPRGLARLTAMLDNWFAYLGGELEQGCLMISGASEYDDRPGPLRDEMVRIVRGWSAELLRAIDAAKDTGELAADTDSEQLAFEIHGLVLVTHQQARLLRSGDSLARARSGLARLLASAASAPPPARATTHKRPAESKRAPSPSHASK